MQKCFTHSSIKMVLLNAKKIHREILQQKCLGFVVLVGKGYFLQNSKISLNLFVKDSCLFTFCWANFFSCSARISLRLACFSFSLLSSSSSLARCLRHSLMYSLNCSSNSPFLAPWRAFKKLPSPLISINILMNWCSLITSNLQSKVF